VKGFVGFIVGLIDGFVSALTDLVTGLVDLVSSIIDVVVKVVRDGITATIDEIKSLISKLDPAEIALAIWGNFVNRWKAADAWERWKFRGMVIGTLVAELLMAIFSGGGALVAKIASKFGKLGTLIKNSKTVAKVLAAADKATDRIPGAKKLKQKARERFGSRKLRIARAIELFSDPAALAGKLPAEVAHLFPSPAWRRGATSGRSSGVKFELVGPRGGQMATVRWSGGETGRHFRGAGGTGQPYWTITSSGGTPSKLWVGPDGALYTKPPVYKAGRVDPADPAVVYSGSIDLPDNIKDLMK
jgi:hypothetical protein